MLMIEKAFPAMLVKANYGCTDVMGLGVICHVEEGDEAHVMLLRLKSVIGRSLIDDWPLCSPVSRDCIRPPQAGRTESCIREHFQSISKFAVGS